MDFIILPENVTSHEPVPDLGGPEYDNQGFQGYALRQGWSITAIREGDLISAREDWNEYSQIVLKDVSPEDIPETGEGLINALVGPFIQTWILFGIFNEALRRPVFRHEFSRNEPITAQDGTVTSTNRIAVQNLFEEFCSKQDELKEDIAWATHLSHCLREAAWVLNDLDRAWETLGGYIVPVSVHLALSVLVETLDHYSIIFCTPHLDPVNAFGGRCKPLEMMLLELGWCPNMIRRVATDLGLDGLYYASLVPSFGISQAHDKCEDHSCVASNIEKGKYRVQHAPRYCLCHESSCDHNEVNRCQCEHIAMSKSDLAKAFDGDGFPLVKFKDNKIEIVSFKSGMKYVAISHVWSDGRGNEADNALPLCQLKTVHQYVAALSVDEDTLFWIDTLCVPIKEPLRNTAIMRMAQVYSHGSHVLVLSEELLSNNLPSTPDQALFWIFCSKWMARLWTMQEAALADNLVFQFFDKAISYTSLADAILGLNINVGNQSRMIGMRANSGISRVAEMHNTDTDTDELVIVDFWHGLRYRSTSRPLDVAICGSILMGTELARLLSAPDEEKMQIFWLCQMEVPASILWCNGPRLKIDGFRWAPSNLMNPATVAVPPSRTPSSGVPMDTGLLVDGLEAIVLENFSRPMGDEIAIRFSLPESTQKYLFVKGTRVENETWNEMEEVWNGRGALLMARLPNSQAALFAALVMPLCGIEHQSNSETEAAPISARYLAQVMIFMEGGEYDHYLSRPVEGFDDEQAAIKYRQLEVLDIAESRRIESSRCWSIC